jgi:hypothetical protein
MAEVWNIPGRQRPGFFPRLTRSLLIFGVLRLGLVATTAVSERLAAPRLSPRWARWRRRLGSTWARLSLGFGS